MKMKYYIQTHRTIYNDWSSNIYKINCVKSIEIKTKRNNKFFYNKRFTKFIHLKCKINHNIVHTYDNKYYYKYSLLLQTKKTYSFVAVKKLVLAFQCHCQNNIYIPMIM